MITRCFHCGHMLVETIAYCPGCGYKLLFPNESNFDVYWSELRIHKRWLLILMIISLFEAIYIVRHEIFQMYPVELLAFAGGVITINIIWPASALLAVLRIMEVFRRRVAAKNLLNIYTFFWLFFSLFELVVSTHR